MNKRNSSLEELIDPMSAPIWKMARQMRMRPEAVFDRLSEAYKKSVQESSLCSDEEGLHFETDFAFITLVAQEEKAYWGITYNPKEDMMNCACLPHPKELFVWPEQLENNVFFPEKVLLGLGELLTGNCELPARGSLEQLMNGYRVTRAQGMVQKEGECLWFDTGLKSSVGKTIEAAIEPSVYDPIPNTWKLVHVEQRD